jgi:hypothetical protein
LGNGERAYHQKDQAKQDAVILHNNSFYRFSKIAKICLLNGIIISIV